MKRNCHHELPYLLRRFDRFIAGVTGFGKDDRSAVFSGQIYPHVEYFEWKEFLDGQQIVKETGPLASPKTG